MSENYVIIVASVLLMIVADGLLVFLGIRSNDSDEAKTGYYGVPTAVAIFSVVLQLTAFVLVFS